MPSKVTLFNPFDPSHVVTYFKVTNYNLIDYTQLGGCDIIPNICCKNDKLIT